MIAVLLVCAGCATQEPEPPTVSPAVLGSGTNRWTDGVIILRNGGRLRGKIRWQPSSRQYFIRSRDMQMRLEEDEVLRVEIQGTKQDPWEAKGLDQNKSIEGTKWTARTRLILPLMLSVGPRE